MIGFLHICYRWGRGATISYGASSWWHKESQKECH